MRIVFMIIVLFVCLQTKGQEINFPDEVWEVVDSPEELGLSLSRLEEAKKYAEEINTEAVMIVVGGKVAYSWGQIDRKYNSHSIRKSFLSALYGKYLKDKSIDKFASMEDLGIDDNLGLSEVEKKATVHDLLKSRSCVYHPALYESAGMKKRKPKRFTMTPGTHWYYNNWDFNVLGTIFEKHTEKSVFAAIDEELAQPIGMEDFSESDGNYITGEESQHRAYPFDITARDLARFGLLMLNEGRWNGKEIIDKDWVKESTRFHSDASLYGSSGYGYMWWVERKFTKFSLIPNVDLPEGTFSANGAGGHYLIVIPTYNMVVVHRVDTYKKNNTVSKSEFGKLLNLIVKARIRR